jgi:hypothetical protein
MANEYLLDNTRLATCVHRLLVLNPDPADNVGLASWHGVRLNVCLFNMTQWTRNQRGHLEQTSRVYDEFPVMLDDRTKHRDLLWNLVTARLPFDEWAEVNLKFCRTWDSATREDRLWPAHTSQWPQQETNASEEAARDALESVQNCEEADAVEDLAVNGSVERTHLGLASRHTCQSPRCDTRRAFAMAMATAQRCTTKGLKLFCL